MDLFLGTMMFLRKRGKASSVTDYCGLGRDPEGFVVHHIDQCIGKFISYLEQGKINNLKIYL